MPWISPCSRAWSWSEAVDSLLLDAVPGWSFLKAQMQRPPSLQRHRSALVYFVSAMTLVLNSAHGAHLCPLLQTFSIQYFEQVYHNCI